MKNLTPAALDQRIAQLTDTLATTEAEVDALSLPAATGDAAAVEKLARATAVIAQLNSDRDILARARASAVNQIDREALEKAAADRAAAKGHAVASAKRLLDMARRADALGAEFAAIVEEMPTVEADLWRELRAAEIALSDGVIGRTRLVAYAIEAVKTAPNLPAFRARPCADIASVAWTVLIDADEQDI
ncbi:hypothetical protein LY56_02916 [Roseinatronobacter thiooxidans]|uniref:Uncharacterized protein n=1 Tax=Roseinatronobacter thiooxidans TaxID=121821 RepID=A0A2W7PV59_9RHOB|nr:hypothetical protein [Roseinatronobacter thiooxidans]PZX39383.1 hypothetical protein LY56_02916 [Roseinatronobacter thiooxidans]